MSLPEAPQFSHGRNDWSTGQFFLSCPTNGLLIDLQYAQNGPRDSSELTEEQAAPGDGAPRDA